MNERASLKKLHADINGNAIVREKAYFKDYIKAVISGLFFDKYYHRLFCANNLLLKTSDFSVFIISLRFYQEEI